MNQAIPALLSVLLGICSITIGACNSGPLSGSGAMRIEVEVYKGPLSQEPEIQWGELVGYLEEAKRALVENLNFTLSIVANKGFDSILEKQALVVDVNTHPSLQGTDAEKSSSSPMYLHLPVTKESPQGRANPPEQEIDLFKPTWCDSLDPDGLFNQLDYFDCIILRGVYVDSLDLIRVINRLLRKYDRSLHKPHIDAEQAALILREVADFSSELRAKGFRWAVASAAGQSFNVQVRIAVLNFVVSGSEFGNQLQARADTLMKQFNGTGHDRRELPLSSHLRETGPTDFVHLYDWLNGTTNAFRYNLPEFLLTGMWPVRVGDRIKIVDRLFADHFWSRINTVYASGKGKVGMAFVKDDLGNWNLKNFDNAPGELLDAYMELGTNLVKKAGELALAVNTGGGSEALKSIQGIQGLVNKAQGVQDSIQSKPNIASESRSRLKALENKTAIALQTLASDLEKQDLSLRDKLQKAEGSDKATLQDQLVAHRKQVLAEFEKVINGYKQQVLLIEKASVSAFPKNFEQNTKRMSESALDGTLN